MIIRQALLITTYVFSVFNLACNSSKEQNTQEGKISIIYSTDLYHPHEDPDDHIDIATLYALNEVEIKLVVIDNAKKNNDATTGRIPIGQLNNITGKNVPYAVGLSDKLKSPDDEGLWQNGNQNAVESIINVLESSAKSSIDIVAVGSLRDITAAYNRKPNLFDEKVRKVLIFIGDASDTSYRDYNVALDKMAYIGLMKNVKNIYWVPVFDGGIWVNNGNASFWRTERAKLFKNLSPTIMNFFIYAFYHINDAENYLEYLNNEVNEGEKHIILYEQENGLRNLWCAAIFTCLTDRVIIKTGDTYRAVMPYDNRINTDNIVQPFTFRHCDICINDIGQVLYEKSDTSNSVMRYKILDMQNYNEIMTDITANLLSDAY